jgi:FOG: EAL domain
MNLERGEVNSYELLLRVQGGKGNYFPKNEYISCVVDPKLHKQYIKWLENYLIRLMSNTEDMVFSLNLDHQELEYSETIDLLEKYSNYKKRLMIEVTEVAPINREGGYFSSINISAIQKIHNLGFRIALDDIGEGINSIGALYAIEDYVDRVKFSTLNFRKVLDDKQLKDLIILLSHSLKISGKEFVVEGVDDIIFSDWLQQEVKCLQQGYLFSIPEKPL